MPDGGAHGTAAQGHQQRCQDAHESDFDPTDLPQTKPAVGDARGHQGGHRANYEGVRLRTEVQERRGAHPARAVVVKAVTGHRQEINRYKWDLVEQTEHEGRPLPVPERLAGQGADGERGCKAQSVRGYK